MAIERVDSFPRPHKFTVEEYLAFEERSEFKHEYIDGVIYDWGRCRSKRARSPRLCAGLPHAASLHRRGVSRL